MDGFFKIPRIPGHMKSPRPIYINDSVGYMKLGIGPRVGMKAHAGTRLPPSALKDHLHRSRVRVTVSVTDQYRIPGTVLFTRRGSTRQAYACSHKTVPRVIEPQGNMRYLSHVPKGHHVQMKPHPNAMPYCMPYRIGQQLWTRWNVLKRFQKFDVVQQCRTAKAIVDLTFADYLGERIIVGCARWYDKLLKDLRAKPRCVA